MFGARLRHFLSKDWQEACKGLEEARRLGVVHRDIKPDNLMLTEQGVLKIADFGIAKPQEDFSMTLTSELIGTPLYMSPEQCQGGANVDFRSDMYSLGATFFYLLTGEPPIRASSVYELIQTKTKLENLCLWKSLPELDENNPLSRVIERMTANDREDRYESYEELLNDLVLVEAGETITVRAKKLKKAIVDREAERVQPAPQKGRMLLVVMLLLVVGGGGGGYWWWSNQDKKNGIANGNRGTKPGPDLAAAKATLKGLRERFGSDGPSKALLTDVGSLVVPPGLSDQKDQLRSDVDAGLKIEMALAELRAPTPEVPFDMLAPFFQAVKTATTVAREAGPELRTWAAARETAARSEDTIGPAAVTELRAELQQWRDDRGKVEGDDAALAKLGPRLSDIVKCRLTLYDLMPLVRPDLEKHVNTATLDKLRLGLTNTAVGPDGTVSIEPRLAEITAEFLAKGPEPALIKSAEDLEPPTPEELKKRNDLVNEMRRVASSVQTARSSPRYPTRPQPPEFRGVSDFFEAIRNALEDVKVAGKMPQWAVDLTVELRREEDLQQAVVRACGDLWVAWQDQRKTNAPAVTLERDKKDLELAVARAKVLFPKSGDALAKAVPLAELQAAMGEVSESARVGDWQRSLAAANAKLTAVRNLTDWQSRSQEMAATGTTLMASLAQLGDKPELARELEVFGDTCKRWDAAKAELLKAANSLASGSVSRCLSDLRSAVVPDGAREFEDLETLAENCQKAFNMAAVDLKVAQAVLDLGTARDLAGKMPLLPRTVPDRISTWLAGMEDLDRESKSMAPILAGVSKNPRGDVKGFFMSRTECSVEEFQQFVEDVDKAAIGADPEARFAAVAARLQNTGMNASKFADMLKKSRGSDPNKPVSASWYEASAYCAWNGLSLPLREEWALAAFGDGGIRNYPWGDTASPKMAELNVGRSAVDVNLDGRSWRAERLHHLAGNMSEWLQAPFDPALTRSDCVGGSFADSGRTALDYASGKRVRAESRNRPPSHVGFRVVLRPREFLGSTWPQ